MQDSTPRVTQYGVLKFHRHDIALFRVVLKSVNARLSEYVNLTLFHLKTCKALIYKRLDDKGHDRHVILYDPRYYL